MLLISVVLFVKCDFSASSLSITCETLKSNMLFVCLLYAYLCMYFVVYSSMGIIMTSVWFGVCIFLIMSHEVNILSLRLLSVSTLVGLLIPFSTNKFLDL